MCLFMSFRDLCREACFCIHGLPRHSVCAIAGLLLFSPPAGSAETDKLAPLPLEEGVKKEVRSLVEQVSEFEFKLGEMRFNSKTREIHIPAAVNQAKDILEYVLVHENGDKVHESLLVTDVKPFHLIIAMLLCDYEPFIGGIFDNFTREGPGGSGNQGRNDEDAAVKSPSQANGPPPHACRVTFEVSWKADGEISRCAVEKLVRNTRKDAGLKETPWAFTGSLIDRKGLQADRTGSIIALYLDPVAAFNCRAPGNRSDDGWLPDTGNMPPPETPVTLTLRPAIHVDKNEGDN